MTVIEAPETLAPDAVAPASKPRRSPWAILYRIGRALLSGVITLVIICGVWVLFLKAFHVSSFIGKGPLDVWRYMFTSSGAGSNRHSLIDESGTTLRDAFLGLVAGTIAAVACAISFNLWRSAASAFMPMAMVLRSVPLVAMTPLIVGIFGRNLEAITVISGIVTFFPTLVNVTLALRQTPRESIDLCRAYGASPVGTLWKVQIPSALPSLFASRRIAAPLSLVGALLAEWLATGQGLGYKILDAAAVSDYTGLWARVVLITAYSAILYQLIGVVERVVLSRFGSIAR
jgi:ABC-type nitrate/sulfonate/bicarbonate transport system permease component